MDAYKAIMSLRINEAKALIQKEKQLNPGNGIIILLENYIDYFRLLASENKADYEKLKDNKSTRISALEDNDKDSPYYLFSQAEVYLQWGLLKAKFGDYLSSALDTKKANSLLTENAQKYPDFLPAKKSQALVNVIFGSIPASFKGITRFLGMSGNAQLGLKQLEALKAELPKTKYDFYNDEVTFFVCNTNIDAFHNYSAYPRLINYLSGMQSNSLLKVFLQGYISLKTAHNDEAIAFLESSPKSGDYVDLPMISYLLGSAKLNRMDSDAPVFLSKYIKDYKGTNYIKDVYIKLAYYYLLQNDLKKYEYYLNLVRTKGYTIDEKDQQALKEANDARPDTDLLLARFYFDGGYYTKAFAQLKNKTSSDFKLLRDKIQLYYRLGRIYDKTGDADEALVNYQKAIDLGKNTSYYFAANAALNMGLIAENRRDIKKAKLFYNQAIGMKAHDYQTSIDNDAKQGLKRIGQ
ncbi:MAG: tetratricopeptide repeat protein [Mucilaginibacter sp.]